jgi:hypothetical protein
MSGRICRTADEAFQAGWEAKCEHGADPGECSPCALTDTEIAQLMILLRHLFAPQQDARET